MTTPSSDAPLGVPVEGEDDALPFGNADGINWEAMLATLAQDELSTVDEIPASTNMYQQDVPGSVESTLPEALRGAESSGGDPMFLSCSQTVSAPFPNPAASMIGPPLYQQRINAVCIFCNGSMVPFFKINIIFRMLVW